MFKLTDNLDLDSVGIAPVTINNTTTNGTGIAMYDAVAVAIVCCAGSIPTGGALAWHVEESADNSSFSDLSGFTATHTDAQDGTFKLIEVRADQLTSGKDYIRIVCVESGSQTCYIAATYVKNAKVKPA